nr:unnamed protein product [Digitaria exilis]
MGGLCMQEKGLSHLSSFLLGTLLPTLLLLFLASDRLSERLSSISSFGSEHLLGSPSAQADHLASNLTSSSHATAPAPSQQQEEEERFPELAELLPRVATEDRTVIITSVNEAWARPGSLLDLFRESFRIGEGIAPLLNHTLVVALDPGRLRHCRAVHPHCYLVEVKGMNVSAANRFNSRAYLGVVWSKLSIQQRILELGYNYLFTDVDVMWFRNPFRHINLYADLTISCDRYFGKPEDLYNSPNTGFYYAKSNNRTVQMLRHWQAARSRFLPANKHDQQIFGAIKTELAGQLSVRIHFVDTALFGSFCAFPGEVSGSVCTMHANCCMGLDNKMQDLTNIIADWKNYTSMTPADRKSGKAKWTYTINCRHSMGRN